MSLDKILSISGKPGLYRLKAQTRTGFVAESLQGKKTISVSIRNNVSMLSEIAIYTYTEEVPLPQVFQKMAEKENGEKALDHKSPKTDLENYFDEVLPEYDEDRVYTSDIKKVVQWYNILIDAGFTNFVEEDKKDENSSEEE